MRIRDRHEFCNLLCACLRKKEVKRSGGSVHEEVNLAFLQYDTLTGLGLDIWFAQLAANFTCDTDYI
jgi:hypothetical protein